MNIVLHDAGEVRDLIGLYVGWIVGITAFDWEPIQVRISGHFVGDDTFVWLDGFEVTDDGDEIRPFSISTEDIQTIEVY